MKLSNSLFPCFAILLIGSPDRCFADIVTAQVDVFNSTPGMFVPLTIGEPCAGLANVGNWSSFPSLIAQQPFYVWKEPVPGRSDPVPADGKISFRVLSDGPVLLAVTDRWGGGGNSSGDWIPELISRSEFEAQGWAVYATPITLQDSAGNPGDKTFSVFIRDSLAGETFTYRTEKYIPPLLLTTQFSVPEPSAFVLVGVGVLSMTVRLVSRLRKVNRRVQL